MFDKFKYFFIKGKLKKFIRGENKPKKIIGKMVYREELVDKFNILKHKSKSFSETLFSFIDGKNITDIDCYKRANVDRKLFSKIRSNSNYKPSKNTVLAFSVALKLNLEETGILLDSAGYSLSRSFVTDMIVEYFITNKKYDINLINIALCDYKQNPLNSF